MPSMSKIKRRTYWFGLYCVVMLIGCAESDEQRTARIRARVLPITGGYTFKQYVTVPPDTKEVLGAEGVFYISPKPFTDADYEMLKQNKKGDYATRWDMMASYYVNERTADVCLATKPEVQGKAGSFGASSPLKISSAYEKDGGIWFRVAVWADFWDDLQLKASNGAVTMIETGAEQGWGFSSSRFVVTPDATVTFQSCLNYTQN